MKNAYVQFKSFYYTTYLLRFMSFFKWCQISGNGLGLHHGDLNIPMGNSHLSLSPWHRKYIGFIIDDSVGLAYALWYHPVARPARPTFGCPRRSLEGPSPAMPMPRTCRRSELFEVGRFSWGIPRALRWWIVAGFWFRMVFGARGNEITKENMGKKTKKGEKYTDPWGEFAARVMSTPDYLTNWGLPPFHSEVPTWNFGAPRH